jgi:hypothetical protein
MTNPARVTLALYDLSNVEVPEALRDAAIDALSDLQDNAHRGRLDSVRSHAKDATDAELMALLGHAQVLVQYQRAARAGQLYLARIYPEVYKVASYAAKDHRGARIVLTAFTAEAKARLAAHKAAAAQFAKALKSTKK